MIKTTLNIGRYAVRVGITHKGSYGHDKILPVLQEVASVRIGSKFSRLVRLILEKGRLTRRFIATNLFATILLSNVVMPGASAFNTQEAPEVVTIAPAPEPVQTQVVRRFPVDNFIVSQSYHFFHPALDIDGVTGDPVFPVMNGKVGSVGQEFFFGKTVRVNHNNSYESVYAHLDTISVKAGQVVTTDTKLGTMGTTGRAFGDHLHMEVYKNGKNVNPYTILPVR